MKITLQMFIFSSNTCGGSQHKGDMDLLEQIQRIAGKMDLNHLSHEQAERAKIVQHGDEMALGRPYSGLLIPKNGPQERWGGTLHQ